VPTALNGNISLVQTVRMYATAGSTVEIGNGGGMPNNISLECNASLSGHFVSAP
jgi:hypothetical protein